ncbi:MAG: ATP-binding protein [Acidobacteriota bacterium]|jgi:signal transduction histidine kinase
MPSLPARNTRVQIILIVAGIVGTSLAHYVTPSSLILWHNIFQRLYYLPIVYAAVSFGLVAGLLAALLSAICYIPHIVMAWHDYPGYVINQYAEIVLFFLVGATTGLLADEQRKKRAELEETARQLEKANQELRDSSEHLKRADRLAAIGNLSAGLAHEIRNPLASIEGAAGILESGQVGEEQEREFLGIIKKECRRMNRLLGDLLDFARPRRPQRQRISVEILLDSVMSLVAHAAESKTIHLIKEVSPPGGTLDCDGEQIKQVILNLLLNAIQAMPNGGDVRLVARPEKSDLRIEVIDRGNGVAPENVDKMFNPFFTTKENGTGLGLAVAHQIVSQHGGTLQARNNPDGGMTFSILIPGARDNA